MSGHDEIIMFTFFSLSLVAIFSCDVHCFFSVIIIIIIYIIYDLSIFSLKLVWGC